VTASAEATQAEAKRREALRKEAQAYLNEGAAYLATAPPCLIAIGGLSGTGKSTLARALAPSLGAAPGAVHLRSDVIRKELWGIGERDRLPERAYEPKVSEDVYDVILERADTLLAARKLSIPFQGLWLSAETDTLVTRVQGRKGDASDATAAVVHRQLDYETGPIRWQGLNAGGGAEEVLRAAKVALEI
jgi:predicted kinase